MDPMGSIQQCWIASVVSCKLVKLAAPGKLWDLNRGTTIRIPIPFIFGGSQDSKYPNHQPPQTTNQKFVDIHLDPKRNSSKVGFLADSHNLDLLQ